MVKRTQEALVEDEVPGASQRQQRLSWVPGKTGPLAGAEGPQTRDPPLNELLHHLHPCVELVQGKDVLLSKQPQSRALPKVLQGAQRAGVGRRSEGAGGVPLCPRCASNGAPPVTPSS